MAPLTDIANIVITADSLGLSNAGFGTLLLLSATASFAERIRSYSSLAAVAADGFPTNGPEYRAASLYFGQTPHPPLLKIGRCANKPTQVYTLSVAAVRNSRTYSIACKGRFTDATASYTSDASATDAEIATGLVAALNAVSGKTFTAAGSASPFTVTGDTAGEWFSLEVSDTADLTIAQTHAAPDVAADLDAIQLVDRDWYALHTFYNSVGYTLAVAAWAESNRKTYGALVSDSAVITGTSGDVAAQLAALSYNRTHVWYHGAPASLATAALFGRLLPYDPGSETWVYKTLAGVAASVLTDTHRTNLKNKSANYYDTVSNGVGTPLSLTFGGKVAGGSLKWIDLVRGRDWIEDDMSVAIVNLLASVPKVPFTDAGVASLESVVRGSLLRATARGIITPDFTVTAPKVATVSSTNRGNRILPDLKWSATQAGAVHTVNPLTGVIAL